LLGLGAVVVLLWQSGFLFARQPFNGLTWTVRKEKLKVTVVARGNLESARNGDIICNVRSGTKGSTNASTIKWLIDNGTEVKGPEWKRDAVPPAFAAITAGLAAAPLEIGHLPVLAAVLIGKEKTEGDIVMILDDSGLQEQLKDQNNKVDTAKSDWVTADKQYSIDEIQCQTDLEKAINARDLAKLDLAKYKEGDYVQALKDVLGRIETARSDLDDWKEKSAWSARMAKKGLMSKVQADADASRREAFRIAVEKVEEEKRVLVDFMYKRTVQDLTAKLAEAEHNLDKTKIQNKATMDRDEAKRQSTWNVYDQELSKKREIKAEIAKCIIRAPQDGLVVYYVPEQVRGGGGSQQSIVAQGEPVREGQKMMQIPDLSAMLVNVRVPEAMVSYLHNEADPRDKSTWQKAQIKVDAFPNRILSGHIRTIDTVASQQDWFASDVKVYKTLVAIDQHLEGLKPGMSAEVTIFAEESATPVLVVPVQAVVGTISMGAERKCFVVGPDGHPQLRDIVVGMSNERLVEVKSGLKEGERVVENPRPLLTDTDMKPGKVRSKNEEDSHPGGGDDGKKGKKGAPKKGGAGPAPDKGPAGKGAGASQFSPEQVQAFMDQMRSKTPVERRDFINALPEDRKDSVRQFLRSKNLEVAD
jgi:RND family efflux transporter MFP subunit